MVRQVFKAIIKAGHGGGAFVEVPFDVKAVYGSARPKVKATFDGKPYRGTIASMDGIPLLGIPKQIRTAIGKDVGETVEVALEPDTAPREVALPADLAKALKSAGLTAAFERLSYTHRKEYITAIEEARKPETRERRIAVMLVALRTRAG